MTHADLASYKPILQPALEGTYHGGITSSPRRIYTTHAPTSGPVVLFILNLLEGYNFIREGATPLNVHRMVESLKCRSYILTWHIRGSLEQLALQRGLGYAIRLS